MVNTFMVLSVLVTLATARLSAPIAGQRAIAPHMTTRGQAALVHVSKAPFGSDDEDEDKPATKTYDAPIKAGRYDKPGSTVTSASAASKDFACFDTDNGAVDSYGSACSAYTNKPDFCASPGNDDDFNAPEMCCVCGGGKKKAFSKPGDCKKMKDGKTWCKDANGWWVQSDQMSKVKVAVDNEAAQPDSQGCYDKGKEGVWCPKSDGTWYRANADGTQDAATAKPDAVSTTPEPVTTSMIAKGPAVMPAVNRSGPPWATLESIPDACIPEPKVPDNYPCLFSAQCENGYCSPRLKMCMADGGSTPVPNDVILQPDHYLFRSIVWDESRPCYSTGCYVCSGDISDSSSKDYKTCFETSSMFGGDPLDLKLFNPASPVCKCDPRFLQAWFTKNWTSCASH